MVKIGTNDYRTGWHHRVLVKNTDSYFPTQKTVPLRGQNDSRILLIMERVPEKGTQSIIHIHMHCLLSIQSHHTLSVCELRDGLVELDDFSEGLVHRGSQDNASDTKKESDHTERT